MTARRRVVVTGVSERSSVAEHGQHHRCRPGRPRSADPDSGSADGVAHRARRPRGRPQREAPVCSNARATAAVVRARAQPNVPAGCSPDDLPALLQRYYWSEPAAEVLGHDPAGARRPGARSPAAGRGAAARARPPSTSSGCADGRAVIRLVTDDMPYLVDSVTAEVVRQGVVARAHRAPGGRRPPRPRAARSRRSATARDAAGCGADALTESWMAVVLDGPLDDEAAADLVGGLRTVLDDVAGRATRTPPGCAPACSSWPRRLEELPPSTPPPRRASDPADDPAEAAALLRWLADGNFVFLGAPRRRPGHGRGASRPRAPCPAPGWACCAATPTWAPPSSGCPRRPAPPDAQLLTVTKADVRSPVHRRAWLDLVAVTLPDGRRRRPAPAPASSGSSRRRRPPAACSTCRWCAAGWPR